jgi:circadian clock protein KaiB
MEAKLHKDTGHVPGDSGLTKARTSDKDTYILRLYITGSTVRSVLAITNLKKICDEYLVERCELEVIDLYKNPGLAKEDQIIATPTLIKRQPLPFRRIIGDMSNKENLLLALELKEVTYS